MSTLRERLEGAAMSRRRESDWQRYSDDIREALTLLERARAKITVHDGGYGPDEFHLRNNPDCLLCALDEALGPEPDPTPTQGGP
jgi:hypothetical protein